MSTRIEDIPVELTPAQATEIVASLPAWTKSVAELDAWDTAQLYEQTQALIAREGVFPPAWAQRLDELFALKVVQLIGSSNSTASDFQALQVLIGLVGNDDVSEQLDAMPAHYRSRWQMLCDAMAVTQRLREFRKAAADRVAENRHVWDLVCDAVSTAGVSGAPWLVLSDVIKQNGGPQSKGGISQMLTAMQGKGLIDSIQRGRNKFYVLGVKARAKDAVSTPAVAIAKMLPRSERIGDLIPIAHTHVYGGVMTMSAHGGEKLYTQKELDTRVARAKQDALRGKAKKPPQFTRVRPRSKSSGKTPWHGLAAPKRDY